MLNEYFVLLEHTFQETKRIKKLFYNRCYTCKVIRDGSSQREGRRMKAKGIHLINKIRGAYFLIVRPQYRRNNYEEEMICYKKTMTSNNKWPKDKQI